MLRVNEVVRLIDKDGNKHPLYRRGVVTQLHDSDAFGNAFCWFRVTMADDTYDFKAMQDVNGVYWFDNGVWRLKSENGRGL